MSKRVPRLLGGYFGTTSIQLSERKESVSWPLRRLALHIRWLVAKETRSKISRPLAPRFDWFLIW